MLIELLVVIAVIALLIAILVPTLQRVRRQAKSIVCQSNLRQWGQFYKMYLADNPGQAHLPYYWPGKPATNSHWLYELRPYWRDCNDVLLCPMTKRYPTRPVGEIWPRDRQWYVPKWYMEAPLPSPHRHWEPPYVFGSYGNNTWIGYMTAGKPRSWWYWSGSWLKPASKVPLFFDHSRDTFIPASGFKTDEGIGPPPLHEGDWTEGRRRRQAWLCMNKHDGGINAVLLDGSARKVGLKELWTLQWHRGYNRANRWTRAGGVRPEDWPEWMRSFKDY